MAKQNYRVFLKSRPDAISEASEENFGYESVPYPDCVACSKEVVIVKTLYLSVDPILRCMLNENSCVEFAGFNSFNLSDTITGVGVGVVVAVNGVLDGLEIGDIVTNGKRGLIWPWQLYFTSAVNDLRLVDAAVIGDRPSLCLTCVGHIGLTSLFGIREKGRIVRGGDNTCVVSGAAGACGSLAGQIARLEGSELVVGICGSDEKCKFLIDELGFDAAINYKSGDVKKRLAELCPNGVDVYFDNVGGEISHVVIEKMNSGGRVILCGQISEYNKNAPYPAALPEDIALLMEREKIEMCLVYYQEVYTVNAYEHKFQDGLIELGNWFHEGKLKVKETFEEGLENAGRAFVKMMRGDNIGKQLVHVADI